MNQYVLALGRAQELIQSHTLSIWQKYVNGINMSYVECRVKFGINCTLPQKENTFHILVNKDSVSIINFLI